MTRPAASCCKRGDGSRAHLRPARISANVRVLNLPFPSASPWRRTSATSAHLLEGQLTVQGQQVAPGETLVVQGRRASASSAARRPPSPSLPCTPKRAAV